MILRHLAYGDIQRAVSTGCSAASTSAASASPAQIKVIAKCPRSSVIDESSRFMPQSDSTSAAWAMMPGRSCPTTVMAKRVIAALCQPVKQLQCDPVENVGLADDQIRRTGSPRGDPRCDQRSAGDHVGPPGMHRREGPESRRRSACQSFSSSRPRGWRRDSRSVHPLAVVCAQAPDRPRPAWWRCRPRRSRCRSSRSRRRYPSSR